MNPFELPGPQFLAFYALFAAVTLSFVHVSRQRDEAGEPVRVPVSDPYAIAYLRGGPVEAVRLAVAMLMDRQLLEASEDVVQRRTGVKPAHGVNDLERGVLEQCERAQAASDLLDSGRLREAARRLYEPGLIRSGLIAGPDVLVRRQIRVVYAAAVLLIVAAIKVAIGVSRNRPVSFLVVSAILFSLATFVFVRGIRTSRGDRVLGDLRTLFEALRARAMDLRPHASTNEFALLMAVFGLEAVPAYYFPFVSAFRRPRPADSTSSCGGSYTSCGSVSSCGGGGSSCGGGGSSCGGGGGCGGCGSS
jgi:uncharacterized protein (TIGR04222 family)